MGRIANQRSAFSHSVTDRKWEFNFPEKSFHFRAQSCPANNRFMEISAKTFDQAFSGFVINQASDTRYGQQRFDRRFFKGRNNSLFVDLLYDQRNQQNEMRFHFPKRL